MSDNNGRMAAHFDLTVKLMDQFERGLIDAFDLQRELVMSTMNMVNIARYRAMDERFRKERPDQ